MFQLLSFSSSLGSSKMTLEDRREYLNKLKSERQEKERLTTSQLLGSKSSVPLSSSISSPLSQKSSLISAPTQSVRFESSVGNRPPTSTSPLWTQPPLETSNVQPPQSSMNRPYSGISSQQPSSQPSNYSSSMYRQEQPQTQPQPQPQNYPPQQSNFGSSSIYNQNRNAPTTPMEAPPTERRLFMSPEDQYSEPKNDITYMNNEAPSPMKDPRLNTQSRQGEIISGGLLSNGMKSLPQTSLLDTKMAERTAYDKWADEKMRWWDEEHKRLQNFLSKLEEDWSRQREDSLKELEQEIQQLKHESVLNRKLSGSLTGYDSMK